jgi:hypothetical protein
LLLFCLQPSALNFLWLTGDDEKKKRLEKVKRNRKSTNVSVVSDDKSCDEPASALSPSGDEAQTFSPPPPAASIVIVPQSSVALPQQSVVTAQQLGVPPVVIQPTSIPSSALDLVAENPGQFAELMRSRLLSLGDISFLPLSLDAATTSILEAVAPAAAPSDEEELLRTLSEEEEGLLREIVEVVFILNAFLSLIIILWRHITNLT